MGLLDSLFNQSTYGGQGGGLLDFLRTTQMQQENYQPSAGFPGQASPIAVGGYQMPRMGDAAQFMPPPNDPAALPPNAQPAQGQLPMQPPQQQGFGGFLEGLNENFQNMGNGGSLIGALTGQRPNNQTAQFLVSKGLDPALARTVVSDPGLLRAVLPQVMGIGGQTDDIKEYQFAKREDPTLTFDKFMARKKSVSGEYGMQPIWGMKDGKPAIVQLGKSGEAKESVLPPGFSPARDPIKIEGPTGTTILDPQTREFVKFIPKDVAGAAKSKEIGEAEGQATVNLPTAIATAENTLKTIKQLEEHPGKKAWGAFGVGAMLPDIPGTDTRGFGALVDQVKGQNFMTAFQSLKGAGAITEQEGAKAEKAQARLDRAQSEKDFDIALKDLKEVVMAGMERARQKAGIKNNQPSPTTDSAPKRIRLNADGTIAQ
ncbi:hypothetical protein GWE18_00395 [Bradyrhizobium sp. CSA112]|uniref:hypothetical protein n=1 Tax=Bradyrhizobium sp. CSA112 TaxID=2699170 RepID=UPI0023B103D0|nr:hypothetical protein [Bradyrhizobium sp. CSA112]MDE5451335.1 hypothetical protein [Bradyrhizobium sp. CSA112]